MRAMTRSTGGEVADRTPGSEIGCTPQAWPNARHGTTPNRHKTAPTLHLNERDRPDRRPRPAAELQRQADEPELAHAVGGQFLQVQRLDDVDARLDDQDRVARDRSELRVVSVHRIPRE